MDEENKPNKRRTKGGREPYAPWGAFIEELLNRWGEPDQVATYKKLAGKFGVSAQTIGQWKKGETPLKATAREAADKAGLPRSIVLFAAGYVPNPEDMEWDRERFPGAVLEFEIREATEGGMSLKFNAQLPEKS